MTIEGTIPEHLIAIADAQLRNELLRLAPPKCEQCTPERECWFCASHRVRQARATLPASDH